MLTKITPRRWIILRMEPPEHTEQEHPTVGWIKFQSCACSLNARGTEPNNPSADQIKAAAAQAHLNDCMCCLSCRCWVCRSSQIRLRIR